MTEFSRVHVELEWAVFYTLDFFHVVADFFEHVANLAVFSFDQCHFKPRIIGFTHSLNFRRGGPAPFTVFGADSYSPAQLGEIVERWDSRDFYEICFWDV